jgi:nucleoid-associated protein YgaU
MPKPEKSNRFSEGPEFKEPRPVNTESKIVTSAPAKSVANSEEGIYDPDEEEGSSFFNLSGIGTVLGGCWGKLAAFSKSALSKTWGWCRLSGQWIWSGLRKIPSYCVIRWDSEDEAELPDTGKKPEPAKVSIKPAENKPETKTKNVPSKIDYDEDELAPSRWWNIGIKTAAAVVAVLILVGGYFAIKPFVKPLWVKVPAEVVKADAGTSVQPTLEPSQEKESSPMIASAPEPVQAAPEPARSVSAATRSVSPKTTRESSKSEALQSEFPVPAPPSQESLFDKDPFFAQTNAPAVAEAAPPIASDPFGATDVASVPSPPVVGNESPRTSTNETLSALQPISPLDSTQTVQPPQLQPLVALDASPLIPTEVAAAPVAVSASANAPVAARYNARQAQRNRNGATFDKAPTPPAVNTIPQTTVQQTLPVIESVREIVPQIPYSGTVQNVPPPVAPPTPVVAEASSVQPEYPNESAPVIPKDAPMTTTTTTVPVAAVPVFTSPSTESSPQVTSADNLPMDWQLWDQIRELRNETEAAPPSNLRFDGAATPSESALRFTPKQAAQATNDQGGLVTESVNSLHGLLPSGSVADTDSLLPTPGKIESALASLENAPKPVFAEALPAYRTNQKTDGAKGMTFQNRIDSEIKRSPSETESYTVQQGDTYMSISDQFYGTSLLYTSLAAHNQQLGIGWRPEEGVVIEIPTAEYLRLHYGESANLQARRLEAQRSAVRYVVQEGDTVFRLAMDKLQDSTRWREISAMNADRLQDVRDLKPGMEILLPTRRL